MRRLFVSGLALAIIAASGVAHAQKGLSNGANLDGNHNARRIEENRMGPLEAPRKAGLAAANKAAAPVTPG